MRTKEFLIILFFILSALPVINAQVKLPRLIRDSMVLQRDVKVKIWGWATKGEKVTIRFNNKNFKTITAADGKWFVLLPATKAGGNSLPGGAAQFGG